MVETINNIDNFSTNMVYSKKLSNMRDSSNYKLESNYIKYIFWSIISIFLIILSFHTYLSSNQSFLSHIVISSAIISILYYFSSYIYNIFL